MQILNSSSAADQRELLRQTRLGDRTALAALVDSQSGLVRRLALSFVMKARCIELDDLIQEGYLAILDAIRCFDPARGYSFSTYAADCVRHRLAEWLRRPSVMPIGVQPVGALEKSDQVKQANVYQLARDLLSQLPPLDRAILCRRDGLEGRWPKARKIARSLGLPQGEALNLYRKAYAALFEAVARQRT